MLTPHALRRELNEEAHARPYAAIQSPARLTSLTLYYDYDDTAQQAAIRHLADLIGLPPLPERCSHYSGSAGDLTVRWSLHTEFARYTFIITGDCNDPFDRTALDRIPPVWLNNMPGVVLVALHAVLLPAERETELQDMATRWFGGRELIGAEIGDGNGVAYTDLRLHPDARLADGFSRYVVVDRAMGPSQSGRMLQRLFEMETYRMLALLALPIAKRQMKELDDLGIELRAITERMGLAKGSDSQLLTELTELATRVEQLIAESQYRFSAAQAYYKLVEGRIGELRESRISGMQPFREFMERRLSPAMNTCETVIRRHDRITARLQRTTALLRTRVEVLHEEQNRALLASMDRRAALQLRLQETVEGLSVGVLTYYMVSLLHHLLNAVEAAGIHLNVELLTGLAIPLVAGAVWLGMRRLKAGINRDAHG
ncbi:DUF3422 domain-containing protein [uncultured Aquitalea sp.]|uniref:DUF3422 family protein n=1 Tax=uncultured Aquitalea sp. TaxID=540272 RepID=UPI0025D88AFD|nr:DUF3422 domain-containing protein [uncultured Aquitalea sp.]